MALVPRAPTLELNAPAPGAHQVSTDRWGPFATLARGLPEGALYVVDRRVARLHPGVLSAVRRRRPYAVLQLAAGERAKSMGTLEKVLGAALRLPRGGCLVAIGGGTVGDLATVAAHLIKRGVRLIQVPTTLLAAVDSSVGGKGAVNLGSVKNAAGVFHYAEASLLCPELFATLSAAQRREGLMEALKMAATLDAATFRQWRDHPPQERALVDQSRALKVRVCAQDPYERTGLRQVLNFGHTFAHVLESLTHHRLRHGEAVGLGMRCALDVGRALSVTPHAVAREVEAGLDAAGALDRRALQRALSKGTAPQVSALLAADKKNVRAGEVRMVLLTEVGAWVARPVPRAVWGRLLRAWSKGDVP